MTTDKFKTIALQSMAIIGGYFLSQIFFKTNLSPIGIVSAIFTIELILFFIHFVPSKYTSFFRERHK